MLNNLVLEDNLLIPKEFLLFFDLISERKISSRALNFTSGPVFQKLGNIEYMAIVDKFYDATEILDQYKYPVLSDYEYTTKFPINNYLPFAEDSSGRNIFYLIINKLDQNYGKVIYKEADYNWDLITKEGEFVLSNSLTDFLKQLIDTKGGYIENLSEIYQELVNQGFR